MKYKLILLAAAAVLAPSTAVLAQAAPQADKPSAPAPAKKPAETSTAVEAVTVTADRNAVRTDIDRRSYSLANDLQATTGSVADALRGVPGVQVDVQGNVSLRGDSNVTILVDGKPSGMFNGDGRADALQQMPADQIERVEVITNPSAAFSPEGTAGVINLISKKARRQDMRTASLRANVGTGERYNGGMSGSVVKGPLTVSGDIGVRHDRQEFTVDVDRERTDPDTGDVFASRQALKSASEGDMYNLRGSLDYDLNATTRFSAEVRRRAMKFDGASQETYEGDDEDGVLETAYDRVADSEFERSNTGGFLRLRRQFDGAEHDLTGDLSFEHTTSDRRSVALAEYSLPVLPDRFEDIRTGFSGDTWRLKVDYNRPTGAEGKLRTGAEFEWTSNDYDNRGERGTAPGTTLPVPALTNQFLYEQDIQALYFTYQRPLGPVTAQFGLRFEAVQIDINQVTSSITDENKYLGLYPTLHLAYELNENQQLTASYSRRIQRPSPQDLNPYVVYIDPFNLRSGNPDLDPQITDSFEAAWQLRQGQKFYVLTAYWRESRDGVTDVVEDLGDGVFLTTRENLARSRNGGVEAIANGKLTSTLSYSLNANAYWNEIDGSGFVGGETRSAWTVQGYGQLSWQATPKDFLQVSGHLMGDRLIPQGEVKGGGMLNLGYRHKFTDKLSLVVTAQDVLGTAEFEQVIDTPLIRERSKREMDFQAVYVGFTWSFGAPRRQPERFEFETGVGPG